MSPDAENLKARDYENSYITTKFHNCAIITGGRECCEPARIESNTLLISAVNNEQ